MATKKQRGYLKVAVGVIACAVGLWGNVVAAQQPIAPVDFRPFVDGRNWIVRQPLVYTIGVSKDTITIPPGFVTDFASIPQVFHSILRQNGLYLLPAVVHDYLYWKQACTRDQSDQILNLGMIENKVPDLPRIAIYGSVRAAGGFAWEANAKDRAAGLVRILPQDRLDIGPNRLWPGYQQELSKAGVVDAPSAAISQSFCARGDLATSDALGTK
jgi:uncharacterized protein DUF1353